MSKFDNLLNFKCCGGNDCSVDSKFKELRYPKEHCMDCDEFPGVEPLEFAKNKLNMHDEMLEALKRWLEWYPNHGGSGSNCNRECRVCNAIEVVAKAEGKETL